MKNTRTLLQRLYATALQEAHSLPFDFEHEEFTPKGKQELIALSEAIQCLPLNPFDKIDPAILPNLNELQKGLWRFTEDEDYYKNGYDSETHHFDLGDDGTDEMEQALELLAIMIEELHEPPMRTQLDSELALTLWLCHLIVRYEILNDAPPVYLTDDEMDNLIANLHKETEYDLLLKDTMYLIKNQ